MKGNTITPSPFTDSLRSFLSNIIKNKDFLLEALKSGASDRITYRIKGPAAESYDADSIIAVIYREISGHGMEGFIETQKRFKGLGVNVPEVYDFFPGERVILLEDGGDLSLEKFIGSRPDKDQVLKIYSAVIDDISRLHAVSDPENFWRRHYDRGSRRVAVEDIYLYDLQFHVQEILLGEYFQLIPSRETRDALFSFYRAIADKLKQAMTGIIYRDLQSQNILLNEKCEPMYIDFQDARFGCPVYDAASLLWDSYAEPDDTVKSELLEYFRKKMNYESSAFQELLKAAVIQRKLHDAGAFALAVMRQNKRKYEQYIKPALCSVLEIMERMDSLAAIRGIFEDLAGKFEI